MSKDVTTMKIPEDALDRDWFNITSEEYRAYHFPSGDCVRINCPAALNVSDSGGHRVLASDGTSHYIPPGWIHLEWFASPAFVA